MTTDSTTRTLEQLALEEFDPAIAGRIKKVILGYNRLVHFYKLSDRPHVVIGNRGQGFFVTPEAENMERCLSNMFRLLDDTGKSKVVALFEGMGFTIDVRIVKRMGAEIKKYSFNTPKGKIQF